MGYDLHEKGTATVDLATCTGCGQCAAICPDQVLTMRGGKPQVGQGLFMGCIACGHCTAVCPTGSITVAGRGMLPDDSFQLPPAFHRSTADQLDALLAARRSVRRFKEQPVDRTALDRILEMTSTAPMGIPPHDVGIVVFHGADRVQAFAADACDVFARMDRFLNPVVLGVMRLFMSKENFAAMRDFIKPLMKMLVQSRRRGEDWFTYNAPAAMLFHYGPLGGPAECHIATTYATLAAESLGLGSCMLGTTEALNHSKPFKTKYGIPPKNHIGLGLILGYPATPFRRGVRRRLASVAFA
jgi:ferredoxin